MEVDDDVDLAAEDHLGGVGVRSRGSADLGAVDRDVDRRRVEVRRGGPDLGDDATPVGVLAEDRGLEEVRPGHRPGDGNRIGFGGRPLGGDGDVVVGAFGVDVELAHEVVAELAEEVLELRGVDARVRSTRAHEDDGVVRRHAPVGVEPVEGAVGGCAQCGVEDRLVEGGVGGDDDEHRRQPRGEHACALGHAADRVPLALPGRGLRDGVGGHDRLGGVLPTLDGVGGVGDEFGEVVEDPGAELLPADADEAGRADEDLIGLRGGAGVGEEGRGLLGGELGGREPVVAGVAVCASGVEDDGASMAGGRDLFGPDDGVGLAAVRRIDGGDGGGRSMVDDEGEVLRAAGFEAGGDSGGGEAEGCGHAHGATPVCGSAVVSSRPRARWMDWRAWPAVPRTRLSSATTTRIFSARAS
ncbi:Uncharacterised protein [Mycobacteroides abscessus subsp. abscessus]|nr:Uncharacterised protein [Mycobacteroides abscessus subsp. abscessus]